MIVWILPNVLPREDKTAKKSIYLPTSFHLHNSILHSGCGYLESRCFRKPARESSVSWVHESSLQAPIRTFWLLGLPEGWVKVGDAKTWRLPLSSLFGCKWQLKVQEAELGAGLYLPQVGRRLGRQGWLRGDGVWFSSKTPPVTALTPTSLFSKRKMFYLNLGGLPLPR